MRTHTNNFKQEIKKFGRQINGKIYYYNNYDIISEDSENILTENAIQLVSEQFNKNNPVEISNELIYSMSIIKNGNLLQSLMKEFDFEAKYELNIGTVVNPQFALMVNNNYEYLNYGDYIIYSKEYNLDTETWTYVCYDMMLYSMIKYIPLSTITYPTTIREYIGAIANKMGISFANENDEFVNYNQVINEELFAGQNVTYRDLLDKLSQITASNILINDNNELEIGYVNYTNDTVDEQYLKDVNVAFSEKFGQINRISIADSENNLEYYAEDISSIVENEKTQINIINNEFAFNGEEQTICQNIFNKLNGLYYSLNDFSTTGICYYDYLDIYNVEAKGETYQCLLLNNEITITNGIEERIFTDKPEQSEQTENNYDTSVLSNKAVTFKINQQDKRLEQAVMEDDIVASLNLAIEDGQGIVELKGNTVIIESDNFNLDADGRIVATSGNIAGFDMTNKNFNVDIVGIYNYDNFDLLWCRSAMMNTISKTQTTYNILDYTNDGNIDVYDLLKIQKIILGQLENQKSISGRIEINSNNPKYCISVKDNNNNVVSSMGLGGINTSILTCNDIVCSNINDYDTRVNINGFTGNIYASGTVTQGSLEKNKKNFEKFDKGLETIKNVDIYKYHLKGQNDNEKKHIGFVIGDKYNYSNEITAVNENGEEIGVDVYSMASVCLQAIKEQQEMIEQLQKEIKSLKKESDK